MTAPLTSATFAARFVDALQRLGVRHACVSPGGRNAPLALALTKSGIETIVHHDERSAAFFALGLARMTGRPVVLNCTSGSAVGHYLPAVIEADASHVPLVVMTADRPPELHGLGAPQTIDQHGVYGRFIRFEHHVGSSSPQLHHADHLAAQAITFATDVPAGPVHINFSFADPYEPAGDPGTAAPPRVAAPMRPPPEEAVDAVAEMLSGRETLIVAGAVGDIQLAAAASELATQGQMPIHADPLSGLRHGVHDRSPVIVSSDAMVEAGWLEANRPEVVIRFGGLPTSKPLWAWLEAHRDVTQVLIDPIAWRDPTRSADTVIRADPMLTAGALAKVVSPGTPGWMERWVEADRRVQSHFDDALEGTGPLTEPATARIVTRIEAGVVGVGSSMPIRDVDRFGKGSAHRVRYVSNRGANGIDGAVSMTLGAVAASGIAGHLLLGDIATIHDLNAFLTAVRLDIPLTTVIVDNDGGGIFHFLSIADTTESADFERVFGTPHGVRFDEILPAMGVPTVTVTDPDALRSLLSDEPTGPRAIVVPSDRTANVKTHEALCSEVASILA